MRGKWDLSIVAATVLLSVVTAATGLFYYHRDQQAVRERRADELHAISTLKVAQLVDWRGERLTDARLNASGIIRTLTLAWLANRQDTQRLAALTERLRSFQSAEGYAAMMVATTDGHILVGSDPRVNELEPPTQHLIARVSASGQSAFGDLSRRSPDDATYLDVVGPIVDDAGRVAAVLILRVDPTTHLYPLLSTWPVPSQSAETLLVRRDADTVLFLSPVRGSTEAPLTLRIDVSQTDVPAVQAVLGHAGTVEGKDYRGAAVLADLAPVPGTPWFMVAKVDADEWLAEVQFHGHMVLTLVAFAVLLTTGLGLLIHRTRQGSIFRHLHRKDLERLAALEELRATLYGIGDGVISVTADGRVARMNRVAEQLTGWREAEAKDRPFTDVFTIVNEDTHAKVESPVERVLDEGVVVGLANHTLLIAKDGTERPIADSGAPVRRLDGSVGGVVLVFRDATRDRDARAATEFRASILENLNDAVIIYQAEGAVLSWNHAASELYGWQAEEVVGRPLAELFDSEPVGHTAAELGRRLHETGRFHGDIRRTHRDGRRLQVEATLSVWTDRKGRHNTIEVDRDVTERRAMEAKLVFADRMLSVGTLAAGVAHEINNPLAYVMANIDFVGSELKKLSGVAPQVADEMAAAMLEARQGAERVRDTVKDLRLLSRAGDETTEALDLTRVIESAIGLSRNEIRHRARMVRELNPVPLVRGNAARLGQVFLNLLVNAAQAIPEGHADHNTIRVSTKVDDHGNVIAEVADSGSGIPAELLSHIFDPFFTTKPVGQAIGLGLPISLGIIRGLGGEIRVDSEVGRGSVFRVILPPSAVVAPLACETPTPAVAAPAQRPRILVVDDEIVLCRAIARQLRADFEVVTVIDAAAALDKLGAGPPFDLIICDLIMPEMTGMELYERVRGTSELQAERMIFMTGGTFTPGANDFAAKVANPCLEKPIDFTRLRQLIRETLERSQQAKSS